ncbi:ABC transporter substrate-binding protein [Romboutsia sp.]|uniref:ABC transporter substrate-binding protein n=1 Tax=Romboutsia sp. TaxID=1965302 RepID=UPI003F3CADBA
MFLRRKLTVMATMALVSATLLAGCSSTESKGGGEATAGDVLGNKNARVAISQAIDKEAICDVILNNGSFPTNIWTAKSLAFDNGKDYADLLEGAGYSYNEEAAKEAWAKAKEEVGFDTVTMEMITYDSDSGKKLAEFVQNELADLEGLTINVTNLPFEQKLDRETKGDFDLSFAGWGADYPDPLTFLATMETGKQYAKQVGYDSADYNKLIQDAMKLPVAEAYAKYAEAEKMMLGEAYLAPLYQKAVAYLEKEYVSGIVSNSWGADYTYTYADVNKPEKVLNLQEASDIPTLDVSKGTDQVSFQTLNSTMEGLTRIDAKGGVQPGVAESWEASEDGLTWTFKLRKDSVWSNGNPVTAKDFEYSWKRTLTPETAAEYSYIMYDLAGAEDYNAKGGDANTVGVKAIDEYTLEVKLVRPIAYFAELMSFQPFYPQNQAFVESCGDSYGTAADKQLYNGPFTLSTWKKEDIFSITKNDKYWDAANVKLNTINYKIVKDTGAAVNLYEAGEIDKVALSAEYVDKYKNDKNYKTKDSASTFMLQVNGGNRPAK